MQNNRPKFKKIPKQKDEPLSTDGWVYHPTKGWRRTSAKRARSHIGRVKFEKLLDRVLLNN